jgi:DNA-binding NarL/FixJ family response regulator
MKNEIIKILIADDHTLFRDGLVALFSSISEIEVVATAKDGQQAIQLAEDLQPDVILMDIQMPKVDGISATRKIIQTSPHVGVIVVTMFEDDDSVFAAMRAGARGYILKEAGQTEMLRTIKSVAQGEALFSPSVATRLMEYLSEAPHKEKDIFPELTDREREILERMAQGLDNPEIAKKLSITLKTVRNHVSNIYNKMQVTDRVQAVLKARDAGMGKEDSV